LTNRTAATRYARALLDVARKEQTDLARIDAELASVVALFRQHPTLDKLLLSPAIPAPKKRATVADLLTHLNLLPIVAKLLLVLAERDRLVLLPDLLSAFQERVMDLQNVVRANVTTAMPLDAERTTAIEQSLARATGRTVVLSTRVDSAIVGGMVARVGSIVYDASIATHLQRLRHRLGESV
jgi:F-type H+-transporting ATPase subunit delta